MAFILTSEGATLFKLSGQATQVTDLLDPKLLFDTDFFGGKCNRYSQNVVRTAGVAYMGGTYPPGDTRNRYSTTFTITYDKTYTTPPPVFACYVNNYSMPYSPALRPQAIVSDSYRMQHHLTSSGEYTWWGWQAKFYTDRAVITTYEFDGDFIIYVMDV